MNENYHFAMEITIDGTGRLVVPKRLRDRFHLVAGAKLEVEADGDGIRLRPVGRGTGGLRRERGVLVHSGDGRLAADLDVGEFIRNQREERALRQSGDTGAAS
jgi:AbrB family looped-hinge helix DNA binding protein